MQFCACVCLCFTSTFFQVSTAACLHLGVFITQAMHITYALMTRYTVCIFTCLTAVLTTHSFCHSTCMRLLPFTIAPIEPGLDIHRCSSSRFSSNAACHCSRGTTDICRFQASHLRAKRASCCSATHFCYSIALNSSHLLEVKFLLCNLNCAACCFCPMYSVAQTEHTRQQKRRGHSACMLPCGFCLH